MLFSNIMIAQRDSLWTAPQLSNMTVYLAQNNVKSTIGGTGQIISHKQNSIC
jgi:hypothetical protein